MMLDGISMGFESRADMTCAAELLLRLRLLLVLLPRHCILLLSVSLAMPFLYSQ